ncbi:unnamed protein product [Prunus brigantina]
MDSVDHDLGNLKADDKGIVMWHVEADQIFLLEADHRIVFYWWKVSQDLGDHSGMFDLPILFFAVTFSHEFFKVRFLNEAVVHSVSMHPMEGTIFASIPLVRISFQGWWSSYPRFLQDSVVTFYNVGLFCLKYLDVISKGFVGLLAQVVQVVKVLLDCPVRGVSLVKM